MVKRERWSSKFIFIMAAVGSAVGLGNIWRFPYLAGKYGGGAFLIPYALMLLAMGIPLLMLEFGIGQKMQSGAIRSFSKIHKSLSGIGVGAILSGFVVTAYYSVVMAWCVIYLYHSFSLAWGEDTKGFFFQKVLHISDSVSTVGMIPVSILLALVLVWILIYFSVWKGVKSVGKVVAVTMPLPIIILIILVFRGVTLPGAMGGISYYLKPDFSALLDFEVWNAAMSQIFFTLTIGFGAMIAYASFQDPKSDISGSAYITALLNSLISIVSGFAVFSTLGYMALKSGVDVSELAAAGPGLAFIVFPKALSLIPVAQFWSVLFFIMLLTLGIDSAFSLVEGVTVVLSDKFTRVKKENLTLYVCIAGFLCGVVYTTQAGLYYLDITDHFITNYGLVIVGLLQVIAVGWVYKAEKLREYINKVSNVKIGYWWTVLIKFVIPVLLIILIGKTLLTDVLSPYEGYTGTSLFIFGWLILLILFVISFLFSLKSSEVTEEN